MIASPNNTPEQPKPRRKAGAGVLVPLLLLAYHHVGYPLLLELWDALRGRRGDPLTTLPPSDELPKVSVIVAAYNEQRVIAAKIENLLALDYPRELLQIVVACDGCDDQTANLARAAGADVVLELPRGGKMASQETAVAWTGDSHAPSELIAFGDANSIWEPGALRALVAAFSEPGVGYACGRVRFLQRSRAGTNQEGLYWRYEMAVRERESRIESVTAGNGAIYAVRRAAWADYRPDPQMGHDLSMPAQLVKAGWRAVDATEARATEAMVPSIEGEFARKRRMMSHAWPIVLRGGLLNPVGYKPRYALLVFSHRLLRYFAPLLHVWLAAATLLRWRSRLARWLIVGQVGLLALAAGKSRPRWIGVLRRPALIARYYVATNLAIALGLVDYLGGDTTPGWDPPEDTR